MKKLNKYLIEIKTAARNGGGTVSAHIGFNSDNLKPVFIYYCGSDTGARYVYIGAAARELATLAKCWEANGATVTYIYGTARDIPADGCSAWNTQQVYYQYAGAAAPDMELYANPLKKQNERGRVPYYD